MSIRDAESMFGQDHAGILKDHIDRITSSRPRDTEVSQVDAERPTQLAVLPRAISRFAPRATLNPASNWGKFSQKVSASSCVFFSPGIDNVIVCKALVN